MSLRNLEHNWFLLFSAGKGFKWLLETPALAFVAAQNSYSLFLVLLSVNRSSDKGRKKQQQQQQLTPLGAKKWDFSLAVSPSPSSSSPSDCNPYPFFQNPLLSLSQRRCRDEREYAMHRLRLNCAVLLGGSLLALSAFKHTVDASPASCWRERNACGFSPVSSETWEHKCTYASHIIYCIFVTANRSFLLVTLGNIQQWPAGGSKDQKNHFCIVFASGLCGNVTVGLFKAKLGYYSAPK